MRRRAENKAKRKEHVMPHTDNSQQRRVRPARPDWPTSSIIVPPDEKCDSLQCHQYAGQHWIAVSMHDCIVMATLRHSIRAGAYRYQIVDRITLDEPTR